MKKIFHRALEHLTRALEFADQLGDMVSVVLASFYLAFALALDCQFQEAFSHIEKPLNINIAVNNLWGVSVMKSNLSFFQMLAWAGRAELSNQQ